MKSIFLLDVLICPRPHTISMASQLLEQQQAQNSCAMLRKADKLAPLDVTVDIPLKTKQKAVVLHRQPSFFSSASALLQVRLPFSFF